MIWIIGIAVAIILYAYIGFPLLLWVRAVMFPRPWDQSEGTPHMSVVIAAYNEAHSIGDRIENLLACDYPAKRLEIVIGSDGSTDATHQVVNQYRKQGVKLMELPRQGKGPTLNAAVTAATGEILVFSDANTVFAADTLRALVRPFTDRRVGGVAGNQVYRRGRGRSSTADGELWYWSYDQWLKNLQSRAGSVTSATGAVYAIRRELFEPVPPGAMDDFFISTGVVQRGYRLVFAPDARAFEPVAEQDGVELSRKWRVIMQGLHAVVCRRELLNPWRYGFYSWQLFTHKVLRRLVGLPVLLLLILFPWSWHAGVWFQWATAFEVVVLSAILAAWRMPQSRFARFKPIVLCVYFAMVNAAAIAAVWSLLWGRRVHRWEPERHQLDPTTSTSKPELTT